MKTRLLIILLLLAPAQSWAWMSVHVAGSGAAPSGVDYAMTLFWRCEAYQMAAGDTYQTDSLWEEDTGAAINTDAVYSGTNGLDIATSGDVANLNNAGEYFTSSQAGRLAFWIRVNTWGDGAGVFDLNLTGANGMYLRMSTTDGELLVSWTGNTESVSFTTSGAGLDPAEWHFVEFKFDQPNNALEVWVDNISVGSSASAMTAWAGGTDGTITMGDTQATAVDYHLDAIMLSTNATQSLYGLREATTAP